MKEDGETTSLARKACAVEGGRRGLQEAEYQLDVGGGSLVDRIFDAAGGGGGGRGRRYDGSSINTWLFDIAAGDAGGRSRRRGGGGHHAAQPDIMGRASRSSNRIKSRVTRVHVATRGTF